MAFALTDKKSFEKIRDAGKKAGVEVKELDVTRIDSTDSFYVIDYTHTYGIGLAKKIRAENQSAKIIIFYPKIRSYVKSEVEKMGCTPVEASDFFSKLKDIMKGKI
ncbi:MAG: hypothetical protein HY517_01620 [Candidatus Aenigmarchaeota archaeon]|nr:hypothetical protein [Candidatus Aenigmarchaeota archaeon]